MQELMPQAVPKGSGSVLRVPFRPITATYHDHYLLENPAYDSSCWFAAASASGTRAAVVIETYVKTVSPGAELAAVGAGNYPATPAG